MESDVNYLAVVVAAVSSLGVGFIWYGKLFRKEWMSLSGITAESMKNMKMSANKAYALQFVASLLMACVLARLIEVKTVYALINSANFSALQVGLSAGFYAWLGFVVPVTIGIVLWENKPWKLWLINASNYLATLLVMGAILALWK